VRLIGEDGKQIGIVPLPKALEIARMKNLDLVEVASNANPPVCKLLDYGKFKYEMSKKEKEARKKQKLIEVKEIRLRPKIEPHDLDVKIKNAIRLLEDDNKVKFILRFRGREIVHPSVGEELLKRIEERLSGIAVPEGKPSLDGRSMTITFAPKKK